MSPCLLAIPKSSAMTLSRLLVAVSPGLTLKQIADDFGISEASLNDWLKAADVEAGKRPGVTSSEPEELRALRRRAKLLEQENDVLRRAAAYLSQLQPGR